MSARVPNHDSIPRTPILDVVPRVTPRTYVTPRQYVTPRGQVIPRG